VLALLNGTAILVIIASILVLVASSRIAHLASNIASTMTDAVLSRVDVEPRQVLANLQSVTADVHTLVVALKQARVNGVGRLDPEIARLSARLSALEANIEQLRDARSLLLDEAIARFGRSLGEGLQNLRACRSGQAAVRPSEAVDFAMIMRSWQSRVEATRCPDSQL
jgi:cell division protein FtsB